MQKKYVAELIGTFIFSLGINMSTIFTHDSQLPNLFSIIASLFCAITLTRNTSGGHLNGAVTMAFTVDELNLYKTRKINDSGPVTIFIFYFLFQIIGAICACTLSYLLYGKHILTFSNENYSLFGIIISEGIATFIFVFNILTQSENRFSKNSSLSTLLIVLGLYTAVNITSILSSGCINPSLAFGHFFSRFMFGLATPFEFYQTLIYISGELIGSILAGLLYNKYFREQVDKYADREQVISGLEYKEVR